jgi:hypothetical protein
MHILTLLALFLTASATPYTPSTNASADQLKAFGGRLAKALQNPAAIGNGKSEYCFTSMTELHWFCFMGDRSSENKALRYDAKQVKTIFEHAKTDTYSGIDFSKVIVTSHFYQSDSFFMHNGTYELRGIFDKAAEYHVYYGAGCLVTESKDFSSMFKGTTLATYAKMQEPIKKEFRDAFYKTWDNKLPCIKVTIKGMQDRMDSTSFGEAEKNVPLEYIIKD